MLDCPPEGLASAGRVFAAQALSESGRQVMGQEETSRQFDRGSAEPGARGTEYPTWVRPSEVKLDEQTGTVLLGLDGEGQIGPELAAYMESRGFPPKAEFHLTLIGFQQGVRLKKAFDENPELADEVAALARSIDWRIHDTGEFYELTKQYEGEDPPRQTIIEMKSCPAAEDFIRQLNDLTGLKLQEQPPHVTLATRGRAQGIGLYTFRDLLERGERIEV